MTDISERSPAVIAIVGPTATGKSALAEEIASQRGGEVVSADSMQVYRGMDIGTAKTPPALRGVPHHLIDCVDPGEPFSAALYQTLARQAIDDILSRGLVPVVCGGTGLYVRAALDDMEFPSGELDSPVRQRLESMAEELGPEAMHAMLHERDPSSAEMIHVSNVRRTIRALEFVEQGVSYAEHAKRFSQRHPYYDTLFIGLTMERGTLYERIERRVDAMAEAGLVEEVSGLLDSGFREALTSAQAIGYKEIIDVLDGTTDLHSALEQVKQATRRYAKRQLSWFTADPRVNWIDVTESSRECVFEQALRLIESHACTLIARKATDDDCDPGPAGR